MDEPEGFDEFVRSRGPALTRYGYVLSGNPHDAADLVQDALVKLRGAWPRVRRRDDPEGYVRTTMARLHVSAWRRRRRERLVADVPDAGYVDAAIGAADGDAGLWRALATLPHRQRVVLVLRHYEGLPDEEIAARLGISRATVRSHAFRGLARLRTDWTPASHPDPALSRRTRHA